MLENDESLIKVFKETLEHLGYDATVVDNGPEAIDIFTQGRNDKQSFDAVILELVFSNREGEEDVLARLREIDPEVKAIVTGISANNPIITNYKSYGFVQAIKKPFALSDLAKAVEEVI